MTEQEAFKKWALTEESMYSLADEEDLEVAWQAACAWQRQQDASRIAELEQAAIDLAAKAAAYYNELAALRKQEPFAYCAWNKAHSCWEFGCEQEDTQNEFTLPPKPLYAAPKP